MDNQIILILKKKIDDLSVYGGLNVETQRNVLKEELQFYVLNFIYHHQEYGNWIMYGGSALRICHGLDRMSVDLDFEITHPVTKKFLSGLKKEIESHFKNAYGSDTGFLTVKEVGVRGLRLNFHIGDKLGINHPSKQIQVKIDLNHFTARKTVAERIPINRDQLSFVIRTYNMSALMASKIAAIFLRGQRGVGKAVYEEKGRDIYDLLWYMTKKIIPDIDYLIAKGIDIKNPRALFDKLTLQMSKVNDANLKQDLAPLFVEQTYIENWLKNWRDSYFHLLDGYKINTITTLESVRVHQDFHTDIFSFAYKYKTEDGGLARIIYNLSEYWIMFGEGNLPIKINEKAIELVDREMKDKLSGRIKQYITLFYGKSEAYLKKTNRIILGDTINTKLIRMTADNLNQKEQIMLNKSALRSCELDDLLK